MKLRETVIVSGGLLIQQVAVFATGVLIARTLGAEAYGILGVLKSLSGIVVIVAALGLDLSLLKHASLYRDRPAELGTVSRALRVVVMACNALVLVAILAGLGSLLARIYDIPDFARLCAITMLGVIFAADIQVSGALYRVFDRVVPFSLIATYAQPLLRLLLSLAALLSGAGVEAIVWINTMVLVATSLMVVVGERGMIPAPAAMPLREQGRKVAAILAESLWMAMSLLVYQLIRLLDVLILAGMVGARAAGEYSAMSSVAQLIQIYPFAISQTLGPRIAAAYGAGDRPRIVAELKQYLRQATILGGFLFGGIAVFGHDLDLVFGASFAFPWPLPALLALGWYLSAVLGPFGYVLSMTGRHRPELAILVAGAALLALLLVLLVPGHQSVGAALAVAVTFAAVNAVRCAYVIRIVGRNPLTIFDLLVPCGFLLLAVSARELGVLVLPRGFPALALECAVYAAMAAGFYLLALALPDERRRLVTLATKGLRKA